MVVEERRIFDGVVWAGTGSQQVDVDFSAQEYCTYARMMLHVLTEVDGEDNHASHQKLAMT